jgi:hypothetical protein
MEVDTNDAQECGALQFGSIAKSSSGLQQEHLLYASQPGVAYCNLFLKCILLSPTNPIGSGPHKFPYGQKHFTYNFVFGSSRNAAIHYMNSIELPQSHKRKLLAGAVQVGGVLAASSHAAA